MESRQRLVANHFTEFAFQRKQVPGAEIPPRGSKNDPEEPLMCMVAGRHGRDYAAANSGLRGRAFSSESLLRA
jgi:hypothetical protein